MALNDWDIVSEEPMPDDGQQPAATPIDFPSIIRRAEASPAGAVSPKGAQTPMQVMPDTWKNPGFGVAPARDDSDAEKERVGVDIANAMLKRYGDPLLAGAAYNAGPGQMDAWLKQFGDPRKGEIDVDQFLNKIPFKETRDYVRRIQGMPYDEATIRQQGAAKQSEGVNPDGSIPGIVSLLDRSKAGENWTTIGVGQDGLNLTYAVPKKPGDDERYAKDPDLYLNRLKKNPKDHYGAFETEDAAAAAMHNAPWQVVSQEPVQGGGTDPWAVVSQEPIAKAPATWLDRMGESLHGGESGDIEAGKTMRSIPGALVPENKLPDPNAQQESFVGALPKQLRQAADSIGQTLIGPLQGALENPPEAAVPLPYGTVPESTVQLPHGAKEEPDVMRQARDIQIASGPLQQISQALAEDMKANTANVRPFSLSGITGQVLTSAPPMIAAVLTSYLTKNPLAGAAVVGGATYGQEYSQERADGISPEKARLGAAVNGISESLGEEIPLDMIMKPGGKFLAKTLKVAGAEGIQEMLTQVIQTGYDKAVLTPDMTWGEAWSSVVQAGIVGAVMGGTISAATHPFTREEGEAKPKGKAATPPAGTGAVPPEGGPPGGPPGGTGTAPEMPPAPTPRPAAAKEPEKPAAARKPPRSATEQPEGEDWEPFYDQDEETELGWYNSKTNEVVKKAESSAPPTTETVVPQTNREPQEVKPFKAGPGKIAQEHDDDVRALETEAIRRAAGESGGEPLGETEAPQAGTREAPVVNPESHDDLEPARGIVNPEPTPAQAEAGNYQKLHVKLHGMDIAIETPKGAERRGPIDEKTGKPSWTSNNVLADYGDIKRTDAADGENLDVYIGPNPQSQKAFVVDQYDLKTGKFDEHKGVLGVDNAQQAAAVYDAGFSDGKGPQRRRGIVEMPVDEFREWATKGDTKTELASQPDVEKPNVTRETIAEPSERPRDSKGRPIFQKGERVVIGAKDMEEHAGRHGTISDVNAMVMRPIYGGGQSETTYHYTVKTDQGTETYASDLTPEVGEAPEAIPDPEHNGRTITPQALVREIEYAKRNEQNTRDAARRAHKPERKRALEKSANDHAATVKRAQATLDAWAEKHPDEAKRLGIVNAKPSAKPGLSTLEPESTSKPAATTSDTSVEVRENEAQNGVEVKFKERPASQTIEKLKAAGFRWSSNKGHWYAKRSPNTLKVANEIKGAPTANEAHAAAAQKPAEAPVKQQWAEIGKNAEGETLYEDGRGVRSIVKNGIRHSEPVGMRPTRAGMEITTDRQANPQYALDSEPESAALKPKEPTKGQAKPIDPEAIQALRREYPNAKDPFINDQGFLEGPRESLNFLAGWNSAKAGEARGGFGASGEKLGFDAYSRAHPQQMDRKEFERSIVMSGAARRDGLWRIVPDVGSGYAVEHTPPDGRRVTLRAPEEIDPWTLEQAREHAIASAFGTAIPAKAPPAAPEPGTSSALNDEEKARYAALQARLKAKLKGQASSGLDPEIVQIGIEMTILNIKSGVRRFVAVAKKTANDIGESLATLRPYLRGWYNAARDQMEDGGLDISGMDDAEGVKAGLVEIDAAIKAEQDGVSGPVPSSAPDERPAGVQPASAKRPTGSAPQGENRPGVSNAGPTSGEGAEGQERPSEGRPGATSGGGTGLGVTPGVPNPGVRGPSAEQRPEDAGVRGTDYRIEPGEIAEGRGPKAKALDNLSAIKLVKQLKAEGRLKAATRAEQSVLAKYVGWGGIGGAFKGSDGKYGQGFEDVGQELAGLLTPEEYQTAARSTQYAHYTAEHVIRSMWDAVKRMGFAGGSVFEPGMGIGHFLGMMPADIAEASRYQGVEMDHLTADIATALYPKSGVRQADFTQTPVPDNAFDLVIGNPPFADTVIKADPKYAARNFMLHDYFFAKSMDALRPGGIMAFVTSAGTMNKLDDTARAYLAQRAEFLGGVRLPSSAFKKNAGTEVTTDILFFQKRPEALTAKEANAQPWIATEPRELPNADGGVSSGNVSRYFGEHPEMVLGEEGFFDKLYKGRYAVRPRANQDLETDLAKALTALPTDIYVLPDTPQMKAEKDFASNQVKDGSFYVKDGALWQYSGGAGEQIDKKGKAAPAGMSAPDYDRVTHLIPIRDALRDVYRADLAEDATGAKKARKALNSAYDTFVKKFGPVNKAVFEYRRPTRVQEEVARAQAREEAIARGEEWDDGDFDPGPMIAQRSVEAIDDDDDEEDAGDKKKKKNKGPTWAQISKARKDARDKAVAEGRTFNEGTFNPEDMPDVVIEKRPNVKAFMDDPESYRLRAIEDYNEQSGEAKKRRVFTESVLTRETEPEIKSAQDGVMWSLNKFGRLDLDAIARQRGQSKDRVITELGDAVFRIPGTHDTYQTSDEYLSGDVLDKLVEAKKYADIDQQYQRNVDALEAAKPQPLPPAHIRMSFGMPWIPANIVRDFANEIGIGRVVAKHSDVLGGWTVELKERGPQWERWSAGSELDANEVMKEALNRTKPRIYQTVRGMNGPERVFDPVATQMVADRIDEVSNAFAHYDKRSNEIIGGWVMDNDERYQALADLYNDKMNRTVPRVFDGSFLTTPGIASDWKWRPHQRRVVARIILSGNTYTAHAVGAGKTSEYIGAGMEMRRLGLVQKPMYVVPNIMLAQFTKEFYEQYPLAKIAVADERRFHTSRRKQFIANVAQDDLDAIILTHSAFGKIPLGPRYQTELIQEEIDLIDEALKDLDKQDDRVTIKKLENKKEKMEQRLRGAFNSKKDQTFTFEEMGVDFLFVDEAHLFRKLDFASRQNIKGIDGEGSNRAFDLYAKTRYLDSKNPGRSLVMGSGTPITNTMGELYTLSKYMQRDALQKRGIWHFDSWAASFGDVETATEPTAQGTYERVTRFRKFVNGYELYKMVSEVMDIVTSQQLEQYVVRPKIKGGARQTHLAPKTEAYERFQADLVARVQAIKNRRGPPQKGDDILLSVINDGRHAAIDMRFIERGPANQESKLNMMIDNVFDIWKRSKSTQFFDPATKYTKEIARGPATQMIFSNLGVNPRGPMGFSGYRWIKQSLVQRGVPADQIAFIGDFKSHIARQKLFNDMNAGKVRVLIGSTTKMGMGVNAQRRLIALHNSDPLWYPADDEQRIGRGLRQGNWNPELEIHDYSTKGTYDEQMWKLMASKARFIEQFFRGDPTLRTIDDVGEASFYEQASAMAASDERIIQLVEMQSDLDRLERQRAAHDREQYGYRSKISHARSEIATADETIPNLKKDIAQRKPSRGDDFSMRIGDDSYDKFSEAGDALEKTLEDVVPKLPKDVKRPLFEIGGFKVLIEKHGKTSFNLYVARSTGPEYVSTGATTGGGLIQAVQNKLDDFEWRIERQENNKVAAKKLIAEIEPLVGKTFAKENDLAELRRGVARLEHQIAPPERPANTEAEVQRAIELNADDRRRGIVDQEQFERDDRRLRKLLAEKQGKATPENPEPKLQLPAVPLEPVIEQRPRQQLFRADTGAQLMGEPLGDLLSDKDKAAIAGIQDVINRMLPAGAKTFVMRRLTMGERSTQGAMFGVGLNRAIAVSLQSADAVGTIRHEVIHWLKDAGLFTPEEWAHLEHAAVNQAWLTKHQISTRYPHLDEAGQIEEAIAEEYAEWQRKPAGKPTWLRRIFTRIAAFMRQTAAAVRKVYGKDVKPAQVFTKAQEVFNRIERGEVAERTPAEQETERAVAARFQEEVDKRPPMEMSIWGRKETVKPPTPVQEDKPTKETVGIGADLKRMIDLFGPKMYGADMPQVTAKELLQNSFDAVKAAYKRGDIARGQGKIAITLDRGARTLTFQDNGAGMTPQVVKDAFLTIAGTNKGDLSEAERSGGFGVAKLAFIFGNDGLTLETVRDGVKTTLDTNSKELLDGKADLKTEPSDLRAGTRVTVKFPETIKGKDGEEERHPMPYSERTFGVFDHPLLGDVEVEFTTKDNWGSPTTTVLPIGRTQDFKGKVKTTTAHMPWGDVEIYMSPEQVKYPHHEVLSSGIYQFDDAIAKPGDPYSKLPYDILMDVRPSVEASDARYPFNNQRENWSNKVRADIAQLSGYLKRKFREDQARKIGDTFSTVQSMPIATTANGVNNEFRPLGLERHLPSLGEAGFRPAPEITIKDGKTFINGEGTDLEQEAREEKALTLNDFKYPDDVVQSGQPYYHNELNVDPIAEAQSRYGIDPRESRQFLARIGTVAQQFQRGMVNITRYSSWSNKPMPVGVSFNKEYKGVHIRVPYEGFFVNPLATRVARDAAIARDYVHTLFHEGVHTLETGHYESFTMEFGELEADFEESNPGLKHELENAMMEAIRDHREAFEAMRQVYNDPNTKNIEGARDHKQRMGRSGQSDRVPGRSLSVRPAAELAQSVPGRSGSGVQEGNEGRNVQRPDEGGVKLQAMPVKPGTGPAFDDPDTEKRWNAARRGAGVGNSLIANAREWMAHVGAGISRHWINLPNIPRFADLQQQLHKLEAAPEAANEEIVRALKRIVGGMSADDLDLFTRKVVLEDLSYEADQGHELPFGLSDVDVPRELAKVDAVIAGRPDIQKRLAERMALVDRIKDALVDTGVLDKSRVKNPAYYRHQVLEYAAAMGVAGKKKLRTPKWAQRMGSSKDINANYLEAEFDWLRKALNDIAAAKTIDWIKQSPHNIRGNVIAAAKARNEAGVNSLLAADVAAFGSIDSKGKPTSPLTKEWVRFRQRIAMGLVDVRNALDDGSLVPPPFFNDAANAIQSGLRDDTVLPFLAWILDNNEPGSMGAAMAFKAISGRRQWVKDHLGENYVDPTDMKGLIKRGIAPEGYTTWQPDEGKLLYTAKTLPERALDAVLNKLAASTPEQAAAAIGLPPTARPRDVADAFAKELVNASRDVMAVGGDKYTMIIPQEVADTLNSLRNTPENGIFDAIIRKPLSMWKQYVLINPMRVMKYNLNNASGDLDAVIAGNPRVLRDLPAATGELRRVMLKGQEPSQEYQDAVDRGVFNAGITLQEIPDVNTLSEFEHLMNKDRGIVAKATAPLGAAWRTLRKYTTFRENMIRYAAYKHYLRRLEAGETAAQIGYGASVPRMVDAVKDNKDKAALLARDLVGDYSAISHFGQGIRRTIIPFWSWAELNARRYWRLNNNAWAQGVGKGLATSGATGAVLGARTTAYLYLRMLAIYGLVALWNNLMFGDDEDKLDPEQARQLHILLGHDSQGQIRSLRVQGAVSDALSWLGFEDAIGAISELAKGRGTIWDIMQAIATAPIKKFVGGVTPVITVPVEMFSGQSYFPDVFNPIPIHDKWREVFRLFSLDPAYDAVMGKPTRGVGNTLAGTLVYQRDPGELAYDTARGLQFDWLRRVKGNSGGAGASTTPRSEALRDWRLAARYGDKRAGQVAFERLKAMGVTRVSLRRSLQSAAPMGAIARKDRQAFLSTLTEQERKRLTLAEKWYEDVFLKGIEESARGLPEGTPGEEDGA